MRELTYETPDDLTLHAYEWAPEGETKGTLQIVHGMAEHALRYARVAEAFTNAGWVVHAHDQRGHGRSVDEAHPLGHLADDDSFHRAVEDAHRINASLRERHGPKVVVMGHSMGSFHTQQLMYQHPGDAMGFVLSGSDGKPPAIAHAGKLVARVERRRHGRRGASALLTKLSFGDFNDGFEGRTDFDWLSRDPAEVDAYVADPLCGFDVSTQTWVDLLDALSRIHRPANQARIPSGKPVYLFAGEEDPVGRKGKGVRMLADEYRAAGVENVTLRLYPGARHEMLNETNRDEVVLELLAWCESLL